MSDTLIREDLGDGLHRVSLNRPPVNALSPAWLMEIAELATELDRDESIRAVVLGSSLKVFSAGVDLKEAAAFDLEAQTAMVEGLNAAYGNLYALSKPLVCAASGAAIAGGMFFPLVSDWTVACPRAKFGLTEVRVGVRFPVGALEIARAELTPAAFRRMLLGGKNVEATTAKDWGVVDQVVDPEIVMDQALEVARDYATIPPKTYAAIKAQMRAPVLETIRTTDDPTLKGWFTDETTAAMTAMLEAAKGGK